MLAALDIEIRRRTNGDASFQHVFRRLNDHDGSLSHNVLVDAVTTTTGQELADWLDRYVCGSDTPEVPDDQSLFRPKPASSPTPEPESEPKSGPESEPEAEPDTLPCPICESSVPSSEQYCPECGQSMHEQCPVCGTDVNGAVYCPECGSDLEEDCPVCGATRVGSEQFCQGCGFAFD